MLAQVLGGHLVHVVVFGGWGLVVAVVLIWPTKQRSEQAGSGGRVVVRRPAPVTISFLAQPLIAGLVAEAKAHPGAWWTCSPQRQPAAVWAQSDVEQVAGTVRDALMFTRESRGEGPELEWSAMSVGTGTEGTEGTEGKALLALKVDVHEPEMRVEHRAVEERALVGSLGRGV